ncbi:MAG: DNA-directed RNA polymerase subunit K [Thermoplasmatota archaeon]
MEYTRLEKARIIGARALQISMGAPLLINQPEEAKTTPVDLALQELEQDVIPMTVKRKGKIIKGPVV